MRDAERGNGNQHALKRGLSVLILKSCEILFVFDASPFAWGLFDLREEESLASPGFATRVRLGAFGLPFFLGGGPGLPLGFCAP